MAAKPGRAATWLRMNFLPHHEPIMRSGAAATTSSGKTMRSLPAWWRAFFRKNVGAAGRLDQLGHPAAAGDDRLVPLLEENPRTFARRRRQRGKAALEDADKRLGLLRRANHCAEHPHHGEYAGEVDMVERVHGDAAADQLRRNVRLQVGIGQHEVGVQRENAVDIGAGERRYARLFAAHLRRPDGEAGHSNNARILTRR